MESLEATVVKSGENVIQTTISRSQDGLSLNVWAHPKVEDFIRSLGTGEHVDIQTLGRHWSSKDKEKLYVYNLSPDKSSGSAIAKMPFVLNCPGRSLLDAENGGEERDGAVGGLQLLSDRIYPYQINISFLRLVGISEGSGVAFTVKGVVSRSGITQLSESIEKATKLFYQEFLKPIRMIVTVSTMPIQY